MRTLARRLTALSAAAAALALVGVNAAAPAVADTYLPITGSGSSWVGNAMSDWVNNVQKYGWKVNFNPNGSTQGRTDFINHLVDFAASDIPFQTTRDRNAPIEYPPAGGYAYMPDVAGGTSFMYNLTIAGKRVTNLRLSGTNITKIFVGQITKWNDPAIQADNPGLAMPAVQIVPVVRSDGSGASAQLTLWMQARHADVYNQGETSFFPKPANGIAQYGDSNVAGYVKQSYANGAIGYVQYSYAKLAKFPVVKMLNAAGYYTEPTPDNVAVALLAAKINTSNPTDQSTYLTQDLSGVYVSGDPRTYELSSYSYLILPRTTQGNFNNDKGRTLAAFAYYATCQGQQDAPELGYSPLPINLAQAAFDQIKGIPGADAQNINIASCHNPTFTPDGHNALVDTAPQPQACDKQGPTQCATGTGGATQSTAVKQTTQSTTQQSGTGATSAATAAAGTVDPDTGLSDDTGAVGNGAVASPVSLSASETSGGWSNATVLGGLAILLLIALFVLPPLVLTVLGRRDPK